jgi:hypothetical protein
MKKITVLSIAGLSLLAGLAGACSSDSAPSNTTTAGSSSTANRPANTTAATTTPAGNSEPAAKTNDETPTRRASTRSTKTFRRARLLTSKRTRAEKSPKPITIRISRSRPPEASGRRSARRRLSKPAARMSSSSTRIKAGCRRSKTFAPKGCRRTSSSSLPEKVTTINFRSAPTSRQPAWTRRPPKPLPKPCGLIL